MEKNWKIQYVDIKHTHEQPRNTKENTKLFLKQTKMETQHTKIYCMVQSRSKREVYSNKHLH